MAPKSRGSQFDPLESSGLRNSNEVRSALLALRNDGCYVSQLANRSELWIFSPNPNFEALVQDSGNGKSDEDLIVAGKATFLSIILHIYSISHMAHD